MKNRMALACLFAIMALPAAAQDEAAPAAADAAPVADAAPATVDAAPAEAITENAVVIDDGSGSAPSSEAGTAEAAPSGDATTDASAAPADAAAATAATDTASADADSSDSTAAEPREGLKLYVGLDYDMTKIDINDKDKAAALGRHRFDSDFYKLRIGVRVFDGIGVEFHAGVPANNASSTKLETKQFYGLYLVPTGVLLNTVEVSARLGYAYTEVKSDQGKENEDGASFGIAFEVPLRLVLGDDAPNIRIGAGGTVYQEDRASRIFGWHGGIRYDFTL